MDIREKMKKDWDRRAKVDPLYWVAATEEADETSYVESAGKDSKAFIDGLKGRVSASIRVLDVGCGIGRMTAPIADHFDSVVGVDVSEEMIEQAKRLHGDQPNLNFAVNNGTDLSEFPDEHFGLALSYSVLPHLPPEVVESYFREINRVLIPGGWFRYQFWVGPERMMADNDTLNIRVYAPEVFNKLNQASGFKVHEIDEIDYFDPVLELKPIWVNVQKTGGTTDEMLNFGAVCESTMSEEEQNLESSLLLYLASKHQDRGEIDNAERVLEEAIRTDPDRPDGYIAWATIRVERDDVRGALKLFEMLTTRVSDFAPGWLFRAQMEEALERKGAALASIRKAEALKPDAELRALAFEIRGRLSEIK
jgi:SAM-dependent methyltransferase